MRSANSDLRSAICELSFRPASSVLRPLLVCLLFSLCLAAWGADVKKGVGLDKISLPSGPGSIEGLGDAFEPQLNTGTSTYGFKVAIPPGVNGLQPDVALHYNAGSGNGAFGLAWSWAPMSIQRQVEKGTPRYHDGDTFVFQGEELVALSDGTWRVENESAFVRFRRQGDGWEIHDKSGKRYVLGQSAEARVQRPGSAGFDGAFKWLVQRVIDTHGNTMEYRYQTWPDSPGQLYCAEIRYSIFGGAFHAVAFDYEPRDDAFSNYQSGFQVRTGRRCSQMRVVSRDALVRRYVLSYTPDPADGVEAVSANDAGLLFSLLRKVTQCDNRAGDDSSYLPPLRFGYTRQDGGLVTRGRLVNLPPFSLGNPNLAFIDVNADALPDLLYTDPDTGQHTAFYNRGAGVFGDAADFGRFPADVRLGTETVQLLDVDGDGKSDLVEKFGGTSDRFVFYRGIASPNGQQDARPVWGGEQSFETPYPPFDFSDSSVRSLDLDNDKHIDFMRTTPSGVVYYLNRTNRWEERGLFMFGEPELGDLTVADDVQFSRPGPGGEVPNEFVKLADMNGDRLLDLVRLQIAGSRLEVVYWPNQGLGRWGRRVLMDGDVDLGVVPGEDAHVQDINGDGLADVVAVGVNEVAFWINRGNGRFSRPFRLQDTPAYIRGQTVLQQADVNGNGSTDFLWENFDPETGSYVVDFIDFLGASKPNLLTTIDNGIGLRTLIEYRTSTDYYLADRAGGMPWRTRLPFPTTVVSKITKRLGLDLDGHPGADEYVSELFYSDGYYDELEKEFRGFAFARRVERGDDRYAGDETITVHSPTSVTRFAFHTGAPDGADNDGNGQMDELHGVSGHEEEPLKGRVLWTEVTLPTADVGGPWPAQVNGQCAADAVVFTRETNAWRILPIHTPTHGMTYVDADGQTHPELSIPATTTDQRFVTFVFNAAASKQILDANGAFAGHVLPGEERMPTGMASGLEVPIATPKVLRSEMEVDGFGNAIAQRQWGEASPGSEYDDERFSKTLYAFNLDRWLIGLPAQQRVTDEQGGFVAETRHYYDGEAFQGLPLGQVGALGDMVREEHVINGAAAVAAFDVITNAVGDPRLPAGTTINVTRSQYDSFGNLIVVRDPLYDGPGHGHEKVYGYDPVFHTFVERETIRVGDGHDDLAATASYEYGAGVMLSATNFNNQSTRFQYDGFWRLVGIVKPGDSPTLPTASFEYRPGDPFRGLYYAYDSSGTLMLAPTSDGAVVNAVLTHQREVSGRARTFDSISFTDGLGHKLGTLHEGDRAGEWIAKDFKRFSSAGEERLTLLPFTTTQASYEVPAENSPHVATLYDAARRPVVTVNPPETGAPGAFRTHTVTVHLPLQCVLYDEEDVRPDSPYFNTPHIEWQDGLDRLVGVTEVTRLNDDGTPALRTNHWLTRYEYDLNDNLTHITDSQGNQKWFRYDGLKRKLFMNDPDRGTMTYSYDAASNLRETLDAKAQRIQYTYDGVNRLLTEDYKDGSPRPAWRGEGQGEGIDVEYHYDVPFANVPVGDGTVATAGNTKGMLAWVEDLSGEEHTSYDARGRVDYIIKRIPDPQFLSAISQLPSPLVSYRTGFAYDALDRVTTLTYPDNDQLGYVYSDRNLLRNIVGGPSGFIISNIVYRASGQLRQIDYGNGVRTTYDYDPRLRLSRLLTLAPGEGSQGEGARLIDFGYDFDGVSNIKSIQDQRPVSTVPAGDPRRNTQIFQYDDLYRITRAQYSFAAPGSIADNGVINYRYDRIGNMLAQTSTIAHEEKGLRVTDLGDMASGGAAGRFNRRGRGSADSPGPHALTRISNLKSQISDRLYPYDANGNMLFIDGLTNTWDFKDRLIQVEDTNMVARYTYDYTDRRVMKRVWSKANSLSPLPSPFSAVLYPDKYFEVREHDAPVKYVWNGNTRVARVTGSLTPNLRVQRFRLWKGWNLVSLAVTGTNALKQLRQSASLSGTGAEGQGDVVLPDAYRWNVGTKMWVAVNDTTALGTGSVLWLRANSNCVSELRGIYAAPGAVPLPTGITLLPNAGLDALPLTNLLSSASSMWRYEPGAQQWLTWLSAGSLPNPAAPLVLAAGGAAFVRVDVGALVISPDPTLQVRYYHQDHLGSGGALCDAVGGVVSEAAYFPFGSTRHQGSSRGAREPYQYTQKEGDDPTVLAYFGVRHAVYSHGRFLGTDPELMQVSTNRLRDPQTFNSYSLVENRVIVRVDPAGAESVGVGWLLSKAVLFAAGDMLSRKPDHTGVQGHFDNLLKNKLADRADLQIVGARSKIDVTLFGKKFGEVEVRLIDRYGTGGSSGDSVARYSMTLYRTHAQKENDPDTGKMTTRDVVDQEVGTATHVRAEGDQHSILDEVKRFLK